MSRDRGTSVLNSHEEASTFFGPRVPNVVKIAAPYIKSVETSMLRKFIQVAVQDIEGNNVPSDAFQLLKASELPGNIITAVYTAILYILELAFRMPPSQLKQDLFDKELNELKIPAKFIEELKAVIFGGRWKGDDAKLIEKRLRFPKLDSLRWRVDVGISTSVLNRVLEPTVMMELKLDNGKIETFEVPVSKFHMLRFNISAVLKEMGELEKRNILKVQA